MLRFVQNDRYCRYNRKILPNTPNVFSIFSNFSDFSFWWGNCADFFRRCQEQFFWGRLLQFSV